MDDDVLWVRRGEDDAEGAEGRTTGATTANAR